MNKFLKFISLAGISLLIAGCASHEKFVKKYDGWVGQNISHLIGKIGYPDSTYMLPNKHKVYVYERSRIYSVPSMGPIGMIGYNNGYGMFGYGGSEVVSESCKLFMETNKKGKIVKWGSHGNSCVSN